MSQQYDNTNRGVLFVNDRKEKDSHPDRKGSINVDGKEYWLTAWNKTTARGETISLSVQAKDGTQQSRQKSAPQAEKNNSFEDDDVPF